MKLLNWKILMGGVTVIIFAIGFFGFSNQTFAANCGNSIDPTQNQCSCGDTVVASTTLASDLICSGNGLTVSSLIKGIIVDGNGHSITGPYINKGPYIEGNSLFGTAKGISSSAASTTIKNFSNISGFYKGITISGGESKIIDNTVNNNSAYGIYSGSGTASYPILISGNVVKYNFGYGIYINDRYNTVSNNNASDNYSFLSSPDSVGIYVSSSNNTFSNNVVNDNSGYGFSFGFSVLTDLSFSGNSMSGNRISNFGNGLIDSSNIIDVTNTVEGKPIYFIKNISDTVYDGDVLGDNIGLFICNSCSNITLKNITLSPNNYYGVIFNGTSGSTIENVGMFSSYGGIYLKNSSGNTIMNNNFNHISRYSITFSGSNSNSINNNILNFSSSFFNPSYSSSNTNTFSGNKFINSVLDKRLTGINNVISTAIHQNNEYLWTTSATTTMILFQEPESRSVNFGDNVNFSFKILVSTSTSPCVDCTFTVNTFPEEEIINLSQEDDLVSGSFVPSKIGTYSLIISVKDGLNNREKRKFYYFIGDTSEITTKYYMRFSKPSHGQNIGNGTDIQTMSLNPPTSEELWYCSGWVQNFIDDLPNYPIANLTGIDSTQYYQSSSTAVSIQPIIGFSRHLFYSGTNQNSSNTYIYNAQLDAYKTIPFSINSFSEASFSTSTLKWSMDDVNNWYSFGSKIAAFVQTNSDTYTLEKTNITNKSYANITYQYTTTPAVKTIFNENVNVLSATASSTDTSRANITLNNPQATATSTTLTLTNFPYPFQNATSVISSDATSTVTSTVSADSDLSLDSVPMQITPNIGSITTTITTWNTSGDYSKQWTESSTNTTSASHTLKDLKPNTNYTVKVDNATYTTVTSNENGEITFNYTGGYSTHTFTVTETPSTPIPGQFTRSVISPVVSATNNALSSLQAKINDLKSLIASLLSKKPVTINTTAPISPLPVTPSSSSFTTNLSFGSRGNDVRQLQIFLNIHGYPVSTTGPGSPGNETTIFGYATKAALIRFQKANNISPIGVFGPTTRGVVNEWGR